MEQDEFKARIESIHAMLSERGKLEWELATFKVINLELTERLKSQEKTQEPTDGK